MLRQRHGIEITRIRIFRQNNMAYLAIERDGSEWIFQEKPVRNEESGTWEERYNEFYMPGRYVCLTKGSIRRITGVELSWESEPLLFV